MTVFIHKNGVVSGRYTGFSTVAAFREAHPEMVSENVSLGDAFAGQLWDGKTLANPPAPPASTNPRDYVLTPRQFRHMAALAGYDDAIDSILAALKANNRAMYAEVKAGAYGSATFHFDKVLAIISNPAVAPLIPKGVDVTKATLTKNWLAAKDY